MDQSIAADAYDRTLSGAMLSASRYLRHRYCQHDFVGIVGWKPLHYSTQQHRATFIKTKPLHQTKSQNTVHVQEPPALQYPKAQSSLQRRHCHRTAYFPRHVSFVPLYCTTMGRRCRVFLRCRAMVRERPRVRKRKQQGDIRAL